ncbi:hypothetical protein QE152_g40703, partial [Popillia japonica]
KKARIPTRDRSDCIKKLKELYEDLRNIEKSKNRSSDLQRKKENDLKEHLDNLCDVAHANTLNMLKINEDRVFMFAKAIGSSRMHAWCRYKILWNRTTKSRATMCFFTERDASLSSGSEDVEIVEEIEMVSNTDSTMLERSPIPATSTAKEARRKIMTPRLSAALDKCKLDVEKKLLLTPNDVAHIITKDLPTDQLLCNSIKLFDRFRLPMEFLRTDPGLWSDDVNYKMGQEILSKLQVVNDPAERGFGSNIYYRWSRVIVSNTPVAAEKY